MCPIVPEFAHIFKMENKQKSSCVSYFSKRGDKNTYHSKIKFLIWNSNHILEFNFFFNLFTILVLDHFSRQHPDCLSKSALAPIKISLVTSSPSSSNATSSFWYTFVSNSGRFQYTRQTFFYIFAKQLFFDLYYAGISSVKVEYGGLNTQSNQTLTNFIQSCIQSFHGSSIFDAKTMKPANIGIYQWILVKSNMSSIKICHYLVQYSLVFWQEFDLQKVATSVAAGIFLLGVIFLVLAYFIYNHSNL